MRLGIATGSGNATSPIEALPAPASSGALQVSGKAPLAGARTVAFQDRARFIAGDDARFIAAGRHRLHPGLGFRPCRQGDQGKNRYKLEVSHQDRLYRICTMPWRHDIWYSLRCIKIA
jgi:hypothetical protein